MYMYMTIYNKTYAHGKHVKTYPRAKRRFLLLYTFILPFTFFSMKYISIQLMFLFPIDIPILLFAFIHVHMYSVCITQSAYKQ